MKPQPPKTLNLLQIRKKNALKNSAVMPGQSTTRSRQDLMSKSRASKPHKTNDEGSEVKLQYTTQIDASDVNTKQRTISLTLE